MKSLIDLMDFYDSNLCDRVFEIKTDKGVQLNITFYREQFCHLIGLQHVYSDRRYLGEKGYNKVKNGKVTLASLIKHNKKGYKSIESRLDNFEHIYDILTQGELIKFYPDRTKPKTKLDADYLMYDRNSGLYLHLFLRSEKGTDYAPVSFVCKTTKDDHPEQFIAGQEYKRITERTIKHK